MNEAERFLADKLKRAETPILKTRPEKISAQRVQTGGTDSADPEPSLPKQNADSGGKGWSVAMAVFAVVMAMFWMAIFKGGCQ